MLTSEQIAEIKARTPRDGHIDETNRSIIARALPYAQKWNNRLEWVEISEWLTNLIRDRRALLDAYDAAQQRIAALENALAGLKTALRQAEGERNTERQTRENALDHMKKYGNYVVGLELVLKDLIGQSEYGKLNGDYLSQLVEEARAALKGDTTP